MADPRHVAILEQGVGVWNDWRQRHLNDRIDLRGADLSEQNLNRANLSEVNLRDANLAGTDLRDAKLTFSSLCGADLQSADLMGADLSNANLANANLSQADLRRANLFAAQAVGTNFQQAILTGTCIQDWQIDAGTNLDDVQCDFIYKKQNELATHVDDAVFIPAGDSSARDREKTGGTTKIWEIGKFSHRLPADPNRTFAPGEFSKLVRIPKSALSQVNCTEERETISLRFNQGIDWQALLSAFQNLKSQYPEEHLTIQGMERQGSSFIVRLEVSNSANKEELAIEIKQFYQVMLKQIEANFEKHLHLRGKPSQTLSDALQSARKIRERERQRNIDFGQQLAALAAKQKTIYNNTFQVFVGSAFAPEEAVENLEAIDAPAELDTPAELDREMEALALEMDALNKD